jgi:hypothetical protein
MRRNLALAPATVLAAVLAAALALGGCSKSKSDDEKNAGAQVAPQVIYVPAATVRSLEIGTTRNGYVITAHGFAPGIGFSVPALRPRREGRPGLDGYIDLDFVARAPDPALNLGEGSVPARAIRADLHLTTTQLRGAAGIRVHGTSGGLQINF